MTGPPVLGDFLSAARRELNAAAWTATGAPARDIEEVTGSLLRLTAAAGRLASDAIAAFSYMSLAEWDQHRTWARTADETLAALSSAAAALGPGHAGRPGPTEPAASGLARRISAVAMSLTVGRDLLQTHFTQRPDGREYRSAWAPVVASPAVSRALLAEVISLTSRAMASAASAPAPPRRGAGAALGAAQRLSVGCQWLAQAGAIMREAHQREPVTAADRELLYVIPGSALPSRPVPAAAQSVPWLCETIALAAERARRLAWAEARLHPRSPAISATSWRQIAASGATASRHCHLLLAVLAHRSAELGNPPASTQLSQAATAASLTSEAWKTAAKRLASVATDVRSRISPAAAAAADLALLTGMLAYAPGWTPASPPGAAVRQPAGLAPAPRDVPHAVSAIHQAADSLSRLAAASDRQIRAAAAAGFIVIPARSEPSHPAARDAFVPAPAGRLHQLLRESSAALTASTSTADALGEIAVAMQSPSRILLTARAATSDPRRRDTAPRLRAALPAAEGAAERQAPGAPVSPSQMVAMAGPFENRMLEIGITNAALIHHAAEIDRAGQKVIANAISQHLAQAGAAPPEGRVLAARPPRRADRHHAPGPEQEREAER